VNSTTTTTAEITFFFPIITLAQVINKLPDPPPPPLAVSGGFNLFLKLKTAGVVPAECSFSLVLILFNEGFRFPKVGMGRTCTNTQDKSVLFHHGRFVGGHFRSFPLCFFFLSSDVCPSIATHFFGDLQHGVTFQGLFILFSYFIFDSLNIYEAIGYLLYSFTRIFLWILMAIGKFCGAFSVANGINFFVFKIF
jgi:hypothetical protein